MGRTATQLLDHHIDAMMGMDLQTILSDYSENLTAITCLDGRTRTMGYDTLATLIPKCETIAKKLGLNVENAIDKLHVLCRQGVGGYAVYLAALKPFSSFASFTYIVQEDKAVYVTGFAKTFWMPNLGVEAHPFAPGDETMAVIERHLEHVRARNAAAMAADYADDAVILTNFACNPLTGRAGAETFCAELVAHGDAYIEALTGVKSKYKVRQAVAELGCVAFRNRAVKKYGVDTYLVKNGKIVFESAMFSDNVPVIQYQEPPHEEEKGRQ